LAQWSSLLGGRNGDSTMKTGIKMYAFAVLIGLLLAVAAVYGQVLAKQYKTMALGPYSVGVVCLDGSKPTVTNSGLVIISCPIDKK
jgi:hypothetical protein